MSFVKVKGAVHAWTGRFKLANTVQWQDHWTARTAMIAANLHWNGARSRILAGDSLFEMIPAQSLEGLNVVNAGFGGATAEHVLASVKSAVVLGALRANPPDKAIIQVGTNDSRQGADVAGVVKNIMAISSLFRSVGTDPIVFAIPPIEERKTAFRSASVATAINDATRQSCLKNGIPFVDPYLAIRGSDDVTEDGIHLARVAIVALVDAIRAA